MDFVLCNGGGIFAGMLTLQYLEMKVDINFRLPLFPFLTRGSRRSAIS